MPELPEVETIRQYLSSEMVGRRVQKVSHVDPRMIKLGEADVPTLIRRLEARELRSVDRRGKFLLLGWDKPGYLVVHLGMSGRLTLQSAQDPIRRHTHLVLAFDDRELRLCDPRRFGRIGWVDQRSVLDAHLGVEPLSARFTSRYLAERLKGRSAPIKTLLLDQRVVAGLGNIYVDEALFLSGIHPTSAGQSLDEAACQRLCRSIRSVLRQSLKHRGTSFSDYVDALGQPGHNQSYLQVYGRGGQPCPRCRHAIATVVLQGRTSHYCPQCQPNR
jgi:formamidopyrimidine-DNA glycosylase